ncbi:hypothetical protein B7494_g2966 [Chlorociboria aeruginascens]|nr:hypothetical protein B7494_g2966 [Chlorociboria aeruginascens]
MLGDVEVAEVIPVSLFHPKHPARCPLPARPIVDDDIVHAASTFPASRVITLARIPHRRPRGCATCPRDPLAISLRNRISPAWVKPQLFGGVQPFQCAVLMGTYFHHSSKTYFTLADLIREPNGSPFWVPYDMRWDKADVVGMNEFFGTQFSQEDLQQRLAQRRSRNAATRISSIPITSSNNLGMDMPGVGAEHSLDEIIEQNSKELQRGQSFPSSFQDDPDRTPSMIEFGGGNGNLNGFQFDTATSGAEDRNMGPQSSGSMGRSGVYSDMGQRMNMTGQQMGFSSSMQASNLMPIDTTDSFAGMSSLSPDMIQTMMGYVPYGMDDMIDDSTPINMFASNNLSTPFGSGSLNPMPNEYIMPRHDRLPSQNNMNDNSDNNMMQSVPRLNITDNSMAISPTKMSVDHMVPAFNSTAVSNIPSKRPNQESYGLATTAPTTSESEAPVATKVEPPLEQYDNIYSSSGFDLVRALMMVCIRKNPEINVGKVDMACAFVVCDVTQDDCPIVYVSDIFERLTGYSKHEVLGRNCRFLQSPTGKVQQGAKRKFTDNDKVYTLKQRLEQHKEVQQSLINYRKGGQPFMNLLTLIPIGWDTEDIKYIVGFQVDVVIKPDSVEGKGVGGNYTMNYEQGELPRYVWNPPTHVALRQDAGQTICHDDVSTVLSSYSNSNTSEVMKRMWDKVLLENTDDLIHVLSLKGIFLYLSPSSRRILEYDSSELVGTALSSVCHPSDIVPVTRELKDTATGASINIVFRIRRKRSGYTWFDSHGSLYVEQGKGRKCIILVGRERPVYTIRRQELEAAGGLVENELWAKISTSGMFLFVSSNVRILLDRPPEDLVGTSIQALMRTESKVEFGRALEKARAGKRIIQRHEVQNKRGLVLQAQTTLYPGDALEGEKPTFLIARTRLIKQSSRRDAANIGSSRSRDQQSELSLIIPPLAISSAQTETRTESSIPRSPASALGPVTHSGSSALAIGNQDAALAAEDNIFEELKTTRCTSWQFELRQMQKSNRLLTEELASLVANKKKRKRRKGSNHLQKDCTGRLSPRTSRSKESSRSNKNSTSPVHTSPLQKIIIQSGFTTLNLDPNQNTPIGENGTAIPEVERSSNIRKSTVSIIESDL